MQKYGRSFRIRSLGPMAVALLLALLLGGSVVNAATIIGQWDFEGNFTDTLGNYDLESFPLTTSVELVAGVGGGQAADFDGGATTTDLDDLDRLESTHFPAISSFNATGWSITGWIRHDQADDQGSSGAIYTQKGFGSGISLGIDTNGGLSFNLTSPGDGRNLESANVDIPENIWTHFAVTWDGSIVDGIEMYLNGESIASTNNSTIGVFTGLVDNGLVIRIGSARGNSLGEVHGLDGQLDHMTLWAGALTPEEVEADYVSTPGSTPPGSDVPVLLPGPPEVSLVFDQVDVGGITTVTITGPGPPPPGGLRLGNPPNYFDLETTASFTGAVEVCIDYSGISFGGPQSKLTLRHRVDNKWEDVTTSHDPDNMIICGSVTSFSFFAIFGAAVVPSLNLLGVATLVLGLAGLIGIVVKMRD